MSFDLNDDARIENEHAYIVNYYNTIVYLNQFINSQSNGGFLKIPFSKPQNIVQPNVSHVSSNFTENYKSTNLYIYKKTHQFDGITYDGELVIENEMITNSSKKMYVCFLLKYGLNYNTAIDKLMKASIQNNRALQKMDLDLSEMLDTEGKYISYDNVIIFPRVITIGTDLRNLKQCDLFSIYSENYKILDNNHKEGFVEGARGRPARSKPARSKPARSKPTRRSKSVAKSTSIAKITSAGTMVIPNTSGVTESQLTCKPIFDSKDAKNSMIVSYSNSETGNQTLTINFLFTLLIFIIIACFANFGSPYLYKHYFIEGSGSSNGVYAQTTIFLILAGILSFALLVDGMIHNKDVAIAGISMITFIFISGLKIFDKIQNDKKITKHEDKYMNVDQSSVDDPMWNLVSKYGSTGWSDFFWKGGIMNGGTSTIIFIFASVISFIITLLIGLGYNSDGKSIKVSDINGKPLKPNPIGKLNPKDPRRKSAENKIIMIIIFGFFFTCFAVCPVIYMKSDKAS